MNKLLTLLSCILVTAPFVVSCSSSDDNEGGEPSQKVIQAEFKLNVVPAIEATIDNIRLMSATSSEATFFTLYDSFLFDIRKVNSEGKMDIVVEAEYLKDFDAKNVKLDDKITLDKQGNFYTIFTNRSQPNRKTIWKFDAQSKRVFPFAKVQNGDLKFISFWPAQNKLLVQDEGKIYTLGLNEQEDELSFFIGGPNGSSSQPKDGTGIEASVRLNTPVSYIDQDFYILESDRFLRKISYVKDEAKAKTISVFESGAFAYLTMNSATQFYIDRKKPEIGLSEGAFDAQEIKSYFFTKNEFYGFPIAYQGQVDHEILVSTAMHVILGGDKNGVKLYTMNTYIPVGSSMWSASKKSIVYIKDFNYQINHVKRLKL
ncbi:hypothetical protein [Myroides odoratus]|uniref:hypothetical protein n=1 Tax=Myroides odoratus TaxID=256 RepID=UPI00333FE60A